MKNIQPKPRRPSDGEDDLAVGDIQEERLPNPLGPTPQGVWRDRRGRIPGCGRKTSGAAPLFSMLDARSLWRYHVIKFVINGGIMVRTQVQLTEDQAKALKKIAASQHQSVAELVRKAVDAMIRTSPLVDSAERQKRAVEIVGKFSSGKRDISKKHDAYLGDAYVK